MVIRHDSQIKLLQETLSSFKDLGKKCFAISKIEDDEILNSLLSNI